MSASLPRQWLEKASEDLVVARLALKEGHIPHACLLSQQCVEKSLKAFLIHKSNSHPHIQNLIDLLERCKVYDNGFTAFLGLCEDIDDYYISTRYPMGSGAASPKHAEADRAIKGAEDMLQFVERRIAVP